MAHTAESLLRWSTGSERGGVLKGRFRHSLIHRSHEKPADLVEPDILNPYLLLQLELSSTIAST